MSKLRIAFPLLALVTMFSSGCLWSRSITRIEDHPERNVTLVETHDRYLFGKQVYQFWQCSDQSDKLECSRTCDGKTDLTCVTAAFGQTNLR